MKQLLLYLKRLIERIKEMGRKRKNPSIIEEVRDFKEQQQEVTDVPEDVDGNKAEPTYTRMALGTMKTEQGWVAIQIPFNEAGDVGDVEIVTQPDIKAVAEERFRIEAANKVLGV